MTSEEIRQRGYDLAGQKIHYYLTAHEGCYCGSIINSMGTREVFLQGDDFIDLEQEIEHIEKQVRWKKLGVMRAQLIIDDLLEPYFGGRYEPA